MNIHHQEAFKMSEQYPAHNHEQAHEHAQAHPEKRAERHLSHAEEQQKKHEQEKNLEHARHEAAHEAQSAEEIADKLAGRAQESPQYEEMHANRELKEMAYQRLLNRARRHMSPYSRAMSHIIHQPIVETVSEVTGKTVGRPSGILGGGILALAGTTAYYYIAKHYGYNYNSFVFLLLLVCGFIAGWVLEIFYKTLRAFSKK
jgi:flagellar biosynthesis GTPase FlhF